MLMSEFVGRTGYQPSNEEYAHQQELEQAQDKLTRLERVFNRVFGANEER